MRTSAAKPAEFEGECRTLTTQAPSTPTSCVQLHICPQHLTQTCRAHLIILPTDSRRLKESYKRDVIRPSSDRWVLHKNSRMVAEHGCDTPWRAPQERISEKICEQIVAVHVPQVFVQVLEVPKISSRDRILQGTVEQILDVPVPEMVEQLVNLPNTVSQDSIQERTAERIADIPVPQGRGGTGGGLQGTDR